MQYFVKTLSLKSLWRKTFIIWLHLFDLVSCDSLVCKWKVNKLVCKFTLNCNVFAKKKIFSWVKPQEKRGAIALSYPPRVRVRATVKLSVAFFHDESSITIGGGYESAIAPEKIGRRWIIGVYELRLQWWQLLSYMSKCNILFPTCWISLWKKPISNMW